MGSMLRKRGDVLLHKEAGWGGRGDEKCVSGMEGMNVCRTRGLPRCSYSG
jgi:hypothetical protein